MAKKKSCQNVRVPRVLSVIERELYGWVDEEIFTQPSVIEADALLELRREMRLTADGAAEGDYVLEAAGPSDRLPFRAPEDRVHFLWVYSKLFTRLGVRLPFTEFQREVLSRCRVAASQLHLNGWGFLRTFERVCLHFGFRPSWHVFLYTYQLHAPLPRKGFMSFRAYHGRKLFDSFEESIQDFKWHYFKVLPFPGKRPFWLNDEGAPFPWVYWNAEGGGDFLGAPPLFPVSQPLVLSRLRLFLRSLLRAPLRLRGNRRVLPLLSLFPVEKEEGVKEDPSADLRQKRRKRKVLEASAEEAALGGDSAWKHKVNPIDRAFLSDYDFRATLDAGLTNSSIREVLEPLVLEQLLGTAQFLACQLTACLQVGMEKTFAAKVEVLTTERDSALAAPLLHAKIKSLTEELQRVEGERLSATARGKKAESLAQSLKGKQTALNEAEATAIQWRDEWRSLGEETGKMVQETFEILMDQVRYLNPAIDYSMITLDAIDYSMITLDTRWDPKAKRIYNPKAEVQDQPEPMEQPKPVEQPKPRVEEQHEEEVVDGEGG
ncbi:hypothetical protein PIB30_057883, partial [Stylosanthes scabra]|nr:hypothetical protein [Stylosanthes scabra]